MQDRLPRLTDMGIVEHIGHKKYVLARSLYAATGKAGIHTRRVGLDRNTNKELLLKHIRENNAVGTPFKELQQVLPGLSRNFATDVLMRQSGISQSDVRNVIETKLRPNCDQIAISNSSRA